MATRQISTPEYQFALSIFQREFPPKDQIFLSDSTGLNGAFFVRPTINGNIRMHMGRLFSTTLDNTMNKAIFAHELTHAWQIAHYGLPWYFAQALDNQVVDPIRGNDAYEYVCKPRATLGDYNAEQQGAIVQNYVRSILGEPHPTHDGGCEAKVVSKTLFSDTWRLLTGSDAVDITVDSDGTKFMVNTAGRIYQYSDNDWHQLSGSDAMAISCNDGVLIMANTAGLIYERTQGRWKKLPGSDAVDVAVASDGTLLMVNSAGKIYKFQRNTNRWAQLPGSDATRISAGGGEIWMVNRVGKIYRMTGSTWSQMSGSSGRDIAVTSKRRVFLTNRDGKIYQRSGSSWTKLDGSDGVAIAANNGELVMVNTKGRLYSRAY